MRSGGISSKISSIAGNFARSAALNRLWTGVVQIGSGSVSGGLGSMIAGGKFWDGFRQGVITAALNHFAHEIVRQQDPLKKHADKAVHTLDEWVERYEDKSWYEIATEAGWTGDGQPAGPHKDWRYIEAPDGNIMDMRHVVVVGYCYGENIGNLVEHVQSLHSRTRASAYDPQDYYSNKIGAYFYQLRYTGSWASNSWSYDFSRFMNAHYRTLFNNYGQ